MKKPTVMVLIHGGAMCLGALKASVPAIVDAFYGGERGAEAIAAVLFGDHNPTGKLPITMYPVRCLPSASGAGGERRGGAGLRGEGARGRLVSGATGVGRGWGGRGRAGEGGGG